MQIGEGGYECEFVDVPHEDDHCVICLLPARDPQQTKCECAKLYCKSCYDQLKTTSGTCPICCQQLDAFPDRKSARKVKDLRVKCTFKGCPWIKELRLLEDHLEKCGYMLFYCDNGCGDQVIRDNLHIHHTEMCILRRHSCEHCNAEGTYKEMIGVHLDKCPDLMVPCPNSGCEVSIKRKDMASHQMECPYETISCPYKDVECNYSSPRHTMADHTATFCGHHLDLAMVQLQKQDKKIDKQNEKIINLEKEITKLQMQHEEKVQTQLQNIHEKQETQLKKLDEKLETQLKKSDEKLETQLQNLHQKQESQVKKLDEKLETQLQNLHQKQETQLKKLDEKLQTQFVNQETKITNLEIKSRSQGENITNLEIQIRKLSHQTYVFKLSQYNKCTLQAAAWKSPIFFTNGYKMRLDVDVNSVWLERLKLENEATLTFPVIWNCSVSILNQLTDGGHQENTLSITMTEPGTFYKICDIPHHLLGLQSQYLRDGSLYFKVKVAPVSWLTVSNL